MPFSMTIKTPCLYAYLGVLCQLGSGEVIDRIGERELNSHLNRIIKKNDRVCQEENDS
jgi:hypothetical protein